MKSFKKIRDWYVLVTNLRLHRKGSYPFIFLICSIVAATAWYYLAPTHEVGSLLSVVGGVAAFVYFLYRQHLDQTKLFKELFTEFNERFSVINEQLSLLPDDTSTISENNEVRKHISNYFDLCGEEYFFYKAGYIRLYWR